MVEVQEAVIMWSVQLLRIGEMEGWGWKWDVHILRPYFRRIGFRKRSGVLVPSGNELRGIKLSKDRGAIGGN